jgi:ABC-type branched-subunit amino acid transport system ATPase component
VSNDSIRLEIDGMCSGYGPVAIVRDVSFALRKNTITTLLGPNGAGKSTTCKSIVGLLPLTTGGISLDGVNITARPCWWRAQAGIFLAPEGRGVFPALSVDDNLRLTIRSAADRSKVYERFANLAARRRLVAGSLSGGEQQMLALAPAWIIGPKILIADEPTLGLAPRAADQVLQLFEELRIAGATILLVGESPRGLIEITDTVVLLRGGRIVWSGARGELGSDTIEQAYFSDVQ